MPDYVPIQNLTILNTLADSDYIPVSDGSGAYAVRGGTLRDYVSADVTAAKTAAQNAASDAADSASAASAAQSAAESAAASAATDTLISQAVQDEFDNYKKGSETKSYSADTGTYINSNTGNANSAPGYSIAKDTNSSYRIPIPAGCSKIVFDNMVVPSEGTAGWATYSTNAGSMANAYLRGGMSNEIIVQETDKYFAVSSAKSGSSFVTTFNITYVYSEIQSDIDNLSDRVDELEKVAETVDYETAQGIYVNRVTGSISSAANYTTAKVGGYYMIKIPDGCVRVILNNVWNYPLGASASGWATYTDGSGSEQSRFIRGGQSRWFDVLPGDKYFAVSSGKYKGSFVTTFSITFVYAGLYGSSKLSNNQMKVVMLGDSIVGSFDGVDSIPYYLSDLTGAECSNGAFPGSSLGSDLIEPSELFEAFNGWKILSAIATNNWTEQQNAIDAEPSLSSVYQAHLDTLKNMDWGRVDVITLSWGTNDWGTKVNLLDNESNLKDTDTFGGAFRTGVEALWSVYPHIKIVCCGVIWRGLTISGGQITADSDDGKHGRNWYLREYEEKLQSLCSEYHIPFVPMYDYTNFNRYTWSAYFPSSDGTHPNELGRFVIAKRYASHLIELAHTI